jgi:hypothetical protein
LEQDLAVKIEGFFILKYVKAASRALQINNALPQIPLLRHFLYVRR